MQRLQELVRAAGATPLVLTPEEHDLVVAGVSHVPLSGGSCPGEHGCGYRGFADVAAGSERLSGYDQKSPPAHLNCGGIYVFPMLLPSHRC